MSDLSSFFSHVYVINLRRRPDRLGRFLERLRVCEWPFREPEVFHAVDGTIVGCPPEFTQGDGAFGCRESHCAILRQHLMAEQKGWVLILEDDADFKPGFSKEVAGFIELVERHARDAEGLMLGGQHHAPPEAVAPGLVRVSYAQRTHAYACRGSYLRALYHRWSTTIDAHIDWRMENWQQYQRVYAPSTWLIGQGGGMSDIRGAVKYAEWWNEPTGYEPVVLLRASKEVVAVARRLGMHTGYNRECHTDFDLGLVQCYANSVSTQERRDRLAKWIHDIQGECLATGSICTVWHPKATLEEVSGATKADVRMIEANHLDDLLAQLPHLRGPEMPSHKDVIVLLRAPREVMEGLRIHGFHSGYWRGEDGIDNGLRKILESPESDLSKELANWYGVLAQEVSAMSFGVVTAWHPKATIDAMILTGVPVVEVAASTVELAIQSWKTQMAKESSCSPVLPSK